MLPRNLTLILLCGVGEGMEEEKEAVTLIDSPVFAAPPPPMTFASLVRTSK